MNVIIERLRSGGSISITAKIVGHLRNLNCLFKVHAAFFKSTWVLLSIILISNEHNMYMLNDKTIAVNFMSSRLEWTYILTMDGNQKWISRLDSIHSKYFYHEYNYFKNYSNGYYMDIDIICLSCIHPFTRN